MKWSFIFIFGFVFLMMFNIVSAARPILNMTFNTGTASTTQANDTSGYGHNSSWLNATYVTAYGVQNTAYYNLQRRHIAIPNFTTTSYDYKNITVIAWVNGTNTLAATIIAQYDTTNPKRGWSMEIVTGQIKVLLSSTGLAAQKDYVTTGIQNVNNSKWHQIAFTFGNGILLIYQDGLNKTVTKTTDTAMTTIRNNSDMGVNVTIGGRYSDGVWASPFIGSGDEILIYNSTLSDAEILCLYNGTGCTASSPSLRNFTLAWNFDSGGLNSSYITDSNTKIQLMLKNDSRTYRHWFMFNITNVSDINLHFQIMNIKEGDGYYITPNNRTPIMYQCNNANWSLVDYVNYTSPYVYFNISFPINCTTAMVSSHKPYTYTKMITFLNLINASAYVNVSYKNHSFENRAYPFLEITDFSIPETNKKNVVIIDRQHTEEVNGNFFLESWINYTINNINATLLQNIHFWIYPMGSPDTVYAGESLFNRQTPLGCDLNDNWNTTSCYESNLLRGEVNYINLTYGIDMFIDIHGGNGNYQNRCFYGTNVDFLSQQSKGFCNNITTNTFLNVTVINNATSDQARYYALVNLSIPAVVFEITGSNRTFYSINLDNEGKNFNRAVFNYFGLVGTAADTCTYTSGDWRITDNCILTTPTDVRPNNIYLECTGTVNVGAQIITDNLYQKAGCILVQKSPYYLAVT